MVSGGRRPGADALLAGFKRKVSWASRPHRRHEATPCKTAPLRIQDGNQPRQAPPVPRTARLRSVDRRTNWRVWSMHHCSTADGTRTTTRRATQTTPQGCRTSSGCRTGMKSLSKEWGGPSVNGCCRCVVSAGGVGLSSKRSTRPTARAVACWSTWTSWREAGELQRRLMSVAIPNSSAISLGSPSGQRVGPARMFDVPCRAIAQAHN
jgi:hypothetical protein